MYDFCKVVTIFQNPSATFCWNSTFSNLSFPQPYLVDSLCGSPFRTITKSGQTSPISGLTHHSKSKPLAKEQATPEYQYRSHIMFLPSLRVRSISFMASHLLALKSKWMASFPMSALLRRKSLIIVPIADLRLGKLMTTALFSQPSPEHFSWRNLVILDFPHLSSPSSTMNLPFIPLQLQRQIIFEMRIHGRMRL